MKSLYLITCLYDEGITESRFRVVEAESELEVAAHIISHPNQWKDFLESVRTRDHTDIKLPRKTLWEWLHETEITAQRFLELIKKTWVDGDSWAQFAIHKIAITHLTAISSQPNVEKLPGFGSVTKFCDVTDEDIEEAKKSITKDIEL